MKYSYLLLIPATLANVAFPFRHDAPTASFSPTSDELSKEQTKAIIEQWNSNPNNTSPVQAWWPWEILRAQCTEQAKYCLIAAGAANLAQCITWGIETLGVACLGNILAAGGGATACLYNYCTVWADCPWC
jgi:hypothetical protein